MAPRWLDAMGAVFFALLIPAVLAAAVTWRQLPRLTAAAVALTVPGFALGRLPNGSRPAQLTDQLGLDVAAVAALDTAWAEQPWVLLAGLWFVVGIVIGLGMLGIALWRSRQAPAWTGIALALGGATHPFPPGNTAQGLGLIVGAIGFGGASCARVRMRDDEFALPPEPIPTSWPGSGPRGGGAAVAAPPPVLPPGAARSGLRRAGTSPWVFGTAGAAPGRIAGIRRARDLPAGC